MCVCVRACVRAFVRSCVRACVRASVREEGDINGELFDAVILTCAFLVSSKVVFLVASGAATPSGLRAMVHTRYNDMPFNLPV